MGAWGSGAFENDDACDWSYQLLDGGGVEVISTALDVATGATAPEAAEAVAAIAVVVASQGFSVDLTPDVAGWLHAVDRRTVVLLAPRALAAIDALLADSELAELWGRAEIPSGRTSFVTGELPSTPEVLADRSIRPGRESVRAAVRWAGP